MNIHRPMTSEPSLPPGWPPARLPWGFRPSAWLTLFGVSVRQFVRGKRWLALTALFALPAILVVVSRYANPDFLESRPAVEEAILFYMIPQALVPLTALILGSGMIRDEVEGQTLTYLLIRPLPRASIYAAKLLAAWVVSAALSAVFISLALVALRWGEAGLWPDVLPTRAAQVTGLAALALLVYLTIFGAISILVRWVLPVGVAYIVIFEGVFANIDFAVRRVTVLYYVRILAERWLGLHVESWSIKLEEAPSGTEALVTLLAVAAVLGVAAAWTFGRREIRLKTPEGN